jgi:uncharacterized protein (DUF2345 family)
VVSPEAICVASGGESVGIMAAHNTDISAGRDITATADGAVSVVAQNADLQLKAAQGKVELHAQNGKLHALWSKNTLSGLAMIKAPSNTRRRTHPDDPLITQLFSSYD